MTRKASAGSDTAEKGAPAPDKKGAPAPAGPTRGRTAVAGKMPLVAVVGRPNVGKSTLFNRLVGERRSIVQNTPGVTRDRIFGEVEWGGVHFRIVDTGGLDPSAPPAAGKQE